MRVLVLTSCTGEKASQSHEALRVEDFDDPTRLRAGEERLTRLCRPAGVMYIGQQHIRVMRGVQAMRGVLGPHGIDVAIVSAGYGLVQEGRMIAPYDVTFAGMSSRGIRDRGARLGLPRAVRSELRGYDLVFSLLGSSYLTAITPPLPAEPGQRIVYFAKPGEEALVRAGEVLVPAGKQEARRYRAGLVALKGRMLEMLGTAVAADGPGLLETVRADASPDTVLRTLDAQAGRG